MATLKMKDLSASKELDSKAMAAVAGGSGASVLPLLLNFTSVSTSFPVSNSSAQVGIQANEVGPFNFGVVGQSNSQAQTSAQLGNLLSA